MSIIDSPRRHKDSKFLTHRRRALSVKQRIAIVSFLFGLFIVNVSSQPKLTQYVTDETRTLTSSQITSLESKLKKFEQETSNQVVVYIIETLGRESLEEMSHEIAEKNKIGQKEKDNGVLLFIVMKDRKLRIEVGYGLEGALPDALADQIIRKEITPYFKQGKYYEGINAGVDAIIKATKGEYKQEKKSSKDDDGAGLWICGLPIFVVIFFGFIGVFIVITVIRSITGWGKRWGSGSGWWYTGGSSGSSWSSGSSSFGGFSGGGGSFGGGGASGSW